MIQCMPIDPDDQDVIALGFALDELVSLAHSLSDPELVFARWWDVITVLLNLPKLHHASLHRLLLDGTRFVVTDLRTLS